MQSRAFDADQVGIENRLWRHEPLSPNLRAHTHHNTALISHAPPFPCAACAWRQTAGCPWGGGDRRALMMRPSGSVYDFTSTVVSRASLMSRS